MENRYFLLLALPAIFIAIILFNFIGQDGYFGLGPMSNGCVGFKVGAVRVEDNLPKGNYGYSGFVRIRYFVPDKPLGKGHTYCIGQDIKNGEKEFIKIR